MSDEHPIKQLCGTLGGSRSGYYQWRRTGVSARASRSEEITLAIKAVHTALRGTYGSPQPSLDTSLPLVALQMALRRHRPPPGVLHHSDRGCQYTIAIFDYIERFHNRSRLHSALGFKSPLDYASNLNQPHTSLITPIVCPFYWGKHTTPFGRPKRNSSSATSELSSD